MVRDPCCGKMGLKKGPWTVEEDQILVTHINLHGHGNWRALPTLAGLLRCGKSCRLRWTNYLRPDIKRGNFSREEEDTIIKLHQMLGNKWSAIAARLPGRTDNEIKNVWHTHLKKRLKQSTEDIKMDMSKLNHTTKNEQLLVDIKPETSDFPLSPPPQCSSGTSFATMTSNLTVDSNPEIGFLDSFSTMDENFWFGVFPTGDSDIGNDFDGFGFDWKAHDSVDFWFNGFTAAAEELQEMMLQGRVL